MEEILSKLDSAVFTDEVKAQIQEKFDSAIKEEVERVQAEMTEAKTQEIDSIKAELLKEQEETLAVFESKMDEYTSAVVEELKSEILEKLEVSEKVEKVEALIEGFQSLLVSNGTKLADIAESSTESTISKELESLKENTNKIFEENIELKKELEKAKKDIAFAEVSEGLTVPEVEKLTSVAKTIVAEDVESFKEKLQILKDNLIVEEKKTEETKESDSIVESKKPADLDYLRLFK